MLIDEAKINVEAGKGGNGLVSFRREKFVPKGGPDGGDGGRGGDVIFKVSRNPHGFELFRNNKYFKAEDGQNGMRQKMKGKDGQDLVLEVPPGTLVKEIVAKRSFEIADLKQDGECFVVSKGGLGGFGNQHFATSIKQAPEWSKPGLFGEKKELELELQLIADVALIGLPNAGKSTLLSVISAAKPKIADYPFTTLEPELGIAKHKGQRIVIADVPGLIEGASKGKGLGDAFLRHIRRTKLLVHLVSGESEWISKDYKTIRQELKKFDQKLYHKPEIVVLTKIDIMSDYEKDKYKEELAAASGQNPILLSAVTHEGVERLLDTLLQLF